DTLSAEVLPDDDQGHERALEPVRAVRQEADDLLVGLGHDQVVALEVRLDERTGAVLADHEGGQLGAAGGVRGAGEADLDHWIGLVGSCSKIPRHAARLHGYLARRADQSMNGTSEAFVGYAKSICLTSPALRPKRIAMAKRLITSPAWGPSRWAPRMRSVPSSTSVLKPDAVSRTRFDENHDEVSCHWVRKRSPLACAASSVKPTAANAGTVKTALARPS